MAGRDRSGNTDVSRRRFLFGLIAVVGIGTVARMMLNVFRSPSQDSTPPPIAAVEPAVETSTTTTRAPSTTTSQAEATTSTQAETTTITEPRPTLVLLEKEAWGAQPEGDGFVEHEIDRITIHHTAAHLGDNSRAPALARQHQRYHQDQPSEVGEVRDEAVGKQLLEGDHVAGDT